MTMSENPVMLITGTRKGIGRYLAHFFVERGFLVVGCSRETPEWSLEGYEHILADVGDEHQVGALFARIHRQYHRLDVTLNNAGIASMNHVLLTPGAVAEKIMRTNFMGTFLMCRESARLMAKRKYGRIINFSTVAVPLALEGEAIYAASKSAIETLTRVLARELGLWGITVNTIGPTPIETDLIKTVPKEKIQSVIDRLAIKRLGTFDDVANLVAFLAKAESGYVTGQTIYLGGA